MFSSSRIVILFGLPGAGKSYVGKLVEKHFNFHFYDGDTDLTPEMKESVQTKTAFTDAMRDEFFDQLLNSCLQLSQEYPKLVIAQTFIKEKYRKKFLEVFPQAQWILVEAITDVREKRLQARKNYPLDVDYSRQMVQNFDKPRIPHMTLRNDAEGEKTIIDQLGEYFER